MPSSVGEARAGSEDSRASGTSGQDVLSTASETAQRASAALSNAAIDAKNKAAETYKSASESETVRKVQEGAKEQGAAAYEKVKEAAEWAKEKVVAGYETVKHAASSGVSAISGSTDAENVANDAAIDGGETGKAVLDQSSDPEAEAALKKIKVGPDTPPESTGKKSKL